MLLEGTIYWHAHSAHIETASGRKLVFRKYSGAVVGGLLQEEPRPTIEEFLRECQIGELGESRAIPGCNRVTSVVLDDAYMKRKWWSQERFRDFFRPGSTAGDFEPKRTRVRRRASSGSLRGSYSLPVSPPVAPSASEAPKRLRTCSECGDAFDPKDERHSIGKVNVCGVCAESDVPKRRGQTFWTHKSVSFTEIEGQPLTDPEEIARSRRW